MGETRTVTTAAEADGREGVERAVLEKAAHDECWDDLAEDMGDEREFPPSYLASADIECKWRWGLQAMLVSRPLRTASYATYGCRGEARAAGLRMVESVRMAVSDVEDAQAEEAEAAVEALVDQLDEACDDGKEPAEAWDGCRQVLASDRILHRRAARTGSAKWSETFKAALRGAMLTSWGWSATPDLRGAIDRLGDAGQGSSDVCLAVWMELEKAV